jgi:hypothetical protein
LLISTSIAPNRSSAAFAMAAVDSSLAMSTARPTAWKPSAAIVSATDFAATPSISAATTRAPALANSSE